MARSPYCVDGDLDVPIGSVLETNGHGETGGEFTVNLTLGRARANGSPRDEVCGKLRDDGIEKFGSGGHSLIGEIDQQFPSDA